MDGSSGGNEAGRHIERGFVVVVARNNLHLTKLAVESALAQDYPCDVLVVDNASYDNTARWALSKRLPCVAYRERRSLAQCWNDALTFGLLNLGRKHALVLNNDVVIRPDAYRWLEANGGGFVTCVSVGKRSEMRYPEPPTTSSPSADFSCFLIRLETFITAGRFDENFYPAYAEDLDYHIRLHKAGIDAACIDVPFLHHGASTLKNADPAERRFIQRGADMGREYLFKKWGVRAGSPEYYALFQSSPS